MKKITLAFLLALCISQAFAQVNPYYFNILSPFQISGFYENSELGAAVDWGWDGEITSVIQGELVYAELENGEHFFCEANTVDYNGKIVLIDRGGCEFSVKASFAQSQGAIAVVIKNNQEGVVTMGAGTLGATVTIPTIMIPQAVGDPITDLLLNGEVVVASLSPTPMVGTVLKGIVAKDDNSDCEYQNGEQPLQQFKVNIENAGNTRSIFTTGDGAYLAGVPAGDYMVSVEPPTPIWSACPPEMITLAPDITLNLDLVTTPAMQCPLLTVDISTARLRRCFDNNSYYINYCNLGSVLAEDASIQVVFPEEIIVLNASSPYTEIADQVFEFQIGDLDFNDCGIILIDVEVSCDAVLGQALCATAEIFPQVECGAPTIWSNVDLRATATCNPDEAVLLELTNTGSANMPEALAYRIINDESIIANGTVQLNAGESEVFDYPVDGTTYRIETDPINFSMSTSLPSAAVEACGLNEPITEGFITQYPEADYGDHFDEDCSLIIGSYDPNDKAANIAGYGPQHYIDQNIDLEYKIRFQNTGTDTAFTVVIIDTLTSFLNPQTIRPIAASHAYELTVVGNILEATFDNILLPDSTTNEPGSNGFITFRIQQMLDVPLESVINNRAGIYFDFNDPVITNTVMHTVGKDFIDETVNVESVSDLIPLTIFPNPVNRVFYIQFDDDQLINSQFRLIDALGRLVHQEEILARNQEVSLNDLSPGVYYYEVGKKGDLLAQGKLVKGN